MRDRSKPRRIWIPGIQFYPIPNVVLKLDYRNIDTWSGSEPDTLTIDVNSARGAWLPEFDDGVT